MIQKRKINLRKLISRLSLFILFIIIAIRFFLIKNTKAGINTNIASLFDFNSSSEYDIIKQDDNKNYLGRRSRKSIRERWVFYNLYKFR